MSLYDRDWYQSEQREKERKKFGRASSYKNTGGWYYQKNGTSFGPGDKDNIMRLLREHSLNGETLVRQGTTGEWTQIRNLDREFPNNGYTISEIKRRKLFSKRDIILIVVTVLIAIFFILLPVLSLLRMF